MKIPSSRRLLLASLFACCLGTFAQAAEVTTTGAEPYRGDLQLVTGTVDLPADGFWIVVPPGVPGGFRQVLSWNEAPAAPDDQALDGQPDPFALEAGKPAAPGAPAAKPAKPMTARYALGGVLCDPALTTATVTLKNWPGGETVTVTWNLAAKPAQADDSKRADAWIKSLASSFAMQPGATGRIWAQLLSPEAVDAVAKATNPRNRFRGGEEQHDTNLFNVLGGRAAVEETLQMQLLHPEADLAAPSIPVASIKGVEVKAHPYADMLGGKPGGHLALAEVIPADRFFVYAGKPQALVPMMNEGAGFIAHLGDMLAKNGADHGLKEKYLARRGTDEHFVKAMLASGLVSEVGLMTPDLFFIDGTDLTTVARVPDMQKLMPILKPLGLGDLADGAIVEKTTPDGGKAYWCAAGDLIIIATDKGEVEKILTLKKNGGAGSLGQSAEFRHMLTQLAPDKETRLFAYLSDPFIRRLTGPAMKIGQLRRLRARAKLEAVSAAALLYEFDGHKAPPSMEKLVEYGYLDEAVKKQGITLDARGVAHSATWGSADRMSTLLAAPVDQVTPAERDAYNAYLADYTQFWRQFFDPIAVRLDDTAGGGLELTTFILPLIDNTIYNGLKEVMVDANSPQVMDDLIVSPAPVLHLAVNFKTELFGKAAKDREFRDLERMTGTPATIVSHFRSPAHFWMMDSDPVIAVGAGNLLGAFGGQMAGSGRNSEMLAIPVVLSALTRPCALAVEVDDPAAVRKLLDMPAPMIQEDGGFVRTKMSKTKYADRDGWLIDFSIEGMLSLHYGLELQGKHLVLTNLPWSQKPKLTEGAAKHLNAAMLEVNPGAVEKQLPALFTADSARQRELAFAGAGSLVPVILAEGADVAKAQARHRELFGYAPHHPGAGNWVWKDGILESDRYGSQWKPLQPAFTPADAQDGLFPGVKHLQMSVQFEDTGLRTVVRWEMGEGK